MIDYSRYYRAFAEMKDTLDGDYAREYLVSAMADADKGNDELSGNAYNRVIDMEWVEMIEGKLPYMQKAIDEQRKFILEFKEVDRIDKVKQVDKDAVRHLTQHANLIMAVEDDGNVIPEKLLNTHREDSFVTYENRFLHTLIHNCIRFVEARFRALQDAPNDSSSKIHMDRELVIGHEKFGFNIDHHAEKHERDKVDREEELSGLTDYERIERIRMTLDDFCNTDLMKALNGCIVVKSPINKTNCIKQDPAFKQCYDLWVFIEGYRKTGYVLEKNVFEGQMPEDVQKDLYDVMAFQHFVSIMSTNSALREKLKAEYIAENERRAAEANKPEEEMQRYIEEKIYEVRREEMALRLKEVREREVIIAKLTAELEQAKEQIRIRDIKIKELESTIAALKQELESVREELRQAQIRIMDLEKEIEELKAYIAELEAKIAQLEAKIRELEAQIAAHLATIAALEGKITELEAHIEKLNAEIDALKEHIAELNGIIAEQKETIAQRDATISEQQTEIGNLNVQIGSLTNTVGSLSAENSDLKMEIDQNKRTIAEQSSEIADKTASLAAANDANEKLTGKYNNLKDDYDAAVEKYSNYQRELNALNDTISDKDAEKKELEHQIRVHVNTISAKDAIISTLRDEKSALTERIDGVGDIMSAREQVAEIETKNVALNNSLRTQVAAMKFRDDEIADLKAQLELAEATKKAEIAAIREKHDAQTEELKAKYEKKIDALESEKVAACTFTDEQKYTIRLNAEKRAIQQDYDAKLAEATKKAKKFVKKARVLVDDRPQALLNLPEAKEYK